MPSENGGGWACTCPGFSGMGAGLPGAAVWPGAACSLPRAGTPATINTNKTPHLAATTGEITLLLSAPVAHSPLPSRREPTRSGYPSVLDRDQVRATNCTYTTGGTRNGEGLTRPAASPRLAVARRVVRRKYLSTRRKPMSNAFGALAEIDVGGRKFRHHSLAKLEAAGLGKISRLPVSIRIVLESLLRNCDGKRVREEDVRALAAWKPVEERTSEVPFVVARVLLQDFTGVPLLVDLAAMRSTMQRLGRDPTRVEPQVPVDLVVDHSVQVDVFGTPDAARANMAIEFQRNRQRYEFLKWGTGAFQTFKIVPPGFGICHQVNLEYLAKGVMEKDGVLYPDTLVGTDSHTTMVNGIGVVGFGVGGIEAEAAMLGQPCYFLVPDVVGVHLTGALRPGVTATDLVLAVTELLRRTRVVGKFVEFHGEGARSLDAATRS